MSPGAPSIRTLTKVKPSRIASWRLLTAVIVGTGPDEAEFKRLAQKLGIEGNESLTPTQQEAIRALETALGIDRKALSESIKESLLITKTQTDAIVRII